MLNAIERVTVAIVSSMLCVTSPALAQQYERKPCPCRYHDARAFASGVCSRTEDEHYCTLNYRTPQRSTTEYQELKRLTEGVGTSVEPKMAFRAFANPDEAHNRSFYNQVLPVVLASSMEPRFGESLGAVTNAIRENVDAIIGPFSKPAGTEFHQVDLGSFKVVVSYGCLEISDEDFSAMVKAAWASARFYCDFTGPSGR